MAEYLNTYLKTVDNLSLVEAINATVNEFKLKVLDSFGYFDMHKCLLYGDVQSGKTSHALGVIAEALDRGFQFVMFLTTDNISLVDQTFERVYDAFPFAEVCTKTDTTRFQRAVQRNRSNPRIQVPIIVVASKNKDVLSNWSREFRACSMMQNKPVLFVDDEADAASLNNKQNSGEVSRINKLLNEIQEISGVGIYVQLTGTPQAILLQSRITGWRPDTQIAFKPGPKYIGGVQLFEDLDNKHIRTFASTERTETLEFARAVCSYIVTCAVLSESGEKGCNMLVHQSRFRIDHEAAKSDIQKLVRDFKQTIDSGAGFVTLETIWNEDLQPVSNSPLTLPEVAEMTRAFLVNSEVNVHIVNSDNKVEGNVDLTNGFHVLVGGDSLGRGLTIPKLQTVFYSRPSKFPQADTLWQHARMFGYDRILRFLRIYMPLGIAKAFQEVHWGNEAIKAQLDRNVSIADMSVELDPTIRPTRPSVVNPELTNIKVGGKNYFSTDPFDVRVDEIDRIVDSLWDEGSQFCLIDNRAAVNILDNMTADANDFPLELFKGALMQETLDYPGAAVALIVRKHRRVSAGKRTLLSPDDRRLGDSITDSSVLTLYRIEGDLGWSSNPIWVPNIKLRGNKIYYSVSD